MSLTDRARTEAERRWPPIPWPDPLIRGSLREKRHVFTEGAEWAASQEPTDAEIGAVVDALHDLGVALPMVPSAQRLLARAILTAAQEARNG